ncbi:hypothetical protein PLESTM_001155900 [Pleodorina starrii]|nr:hypothetical protein PLESTM_001155900 [Pleodorina starrii]
MKECTYNQLTFRRENNPIYEIDLPCNGTRSGGIPFDFINGKSNSMKNSDNEVYGLPELVLQHMRRWFGRYGRPRLQVSTATAATAFAAAAISPFTAAAPSGTAFASTPSFPQVATIHTVSTPGTITSSTAPPAVATSLATTFTIAALAPTFTTPTPAWPPSSETPIGAVISSSAPKRSALWGHDTNPPQSFPTTEAVATTAFTSFAPPAALTSPAPPAAERINNHA